MGTTLTGFWRPEDNGPLDTVASDVAACECRPGDLPTLCSDGLHGDVPYSLIADALLAADENALDTCCAALVELAKTYGSRDNIAVLLVLAAA